MLAGGGLQQYHAQCPIIGLGIDDAGQAFRRGVRHRVRDTGVTLGGVQYRSNPKIGQYQIQWFKLPDQNIFRFQITMHQAVGMNVGQSQCQFLRNGTNQFGRQPPAVVRL